MNVICDFSVALTFNSFLKKGSTPLGKESSFEGKIQTVAVLTVIALESVYLNMNRDQAFPCRMN